MTSKKAAVKIAPEDRWNIQTGRPIVAVNRTIQPADVQDGLAVTAFQKTLEPFEFLAKYFNLTALMSAENKAVTAGQEQAATLFRKAADRTQWVGAKGR